MTAGTTRGWEACSNWVRLAGESPDVKIEGLASVDDFDVLCAYRLVAL